MHYVDEMNSRKNFFRRWVITALESKRQNNGDVETRCRFPLVALGCSEMSWASAFAETLSKLPTQLLSG